MILPSIYITNEYGQPVSGLQKSDINIYWIDLLTGEKNLIGNEIDLVEDSEVAGLYRITNFPDKEYGEYSEVVVVYQNNLIATLLREGETKHIGVIPVVITIEDLNGNKLVGVEMVVTDLEGNMLLSGLVSDNNGKIYLSLNTGSYALYCYRVRTLFNNPIILNVVEPKTELVIKANVVEVLSPSLGKVVLYGYIYDLQGKPVEKTQVQVNTKPPLPKKHQNVMLSAFISSTFTDKNGYFELVLLGGTEVEITIPAIGMKKSCLLPKSGVINITEL